MKKLTVILDDSGGLSQDNDFNSLEFLGLLEYLKLEVELKICDHFKKTNFGEPKNEAQNNELLEMKIKNTNLSTRAKKCLNAAEVYIIAELITFTRWELSRFSNLGKNSLKEIELFLLENGLKLKGL